MNTVDTYSTFFNTQMPIDPSISVLSSDHGNVIEYNLPLGKRPRESSLSFLGDDISSQFLQQSQDVDRLILCHAEKVRTELLERRQSIFHKALEESVSRRLRTKDEEIQRIGKLNWALQEQIKLLCLDCQVWRELAQTNEAAAVGLRSNLEQVLAGRVLGTMEDAESCCGGEEEQQQCDTVVSRLSNVCMNCGKGESSVLLLPCRHLSICSGCGPAVNVCPVCRCSKVGSINVNIF